MFRAGALRTVARMDPRTSPVAGPPSAPRTRDAGVELAWRALETAPDDPVARIALARRLHLESENIDPGREALLHSLLIDPDIDPDRVSRAGWRLIERAGRLPAPTTSPADVAAWLEEDRFARDLLMEARVRVLGVERLLTRLRRWLLLKDRADAFPLTLAALIRQAALNGGAWPFDAAERARLDALGEASIVAAFRRPRPELRAAQDFSAAVTRSVAEQYEGWPFPTWERLMVSPHATLTARIKALGPPAPTALPDAMEILVAGCGAGRGALHLARLTPKSRITAIDLSTASLAYAAERADPAANVEFRRHDLHNVASLGRRFDYISCCGVLHHLPDPEAGWAALTGVLKPGGLMRVMLYSKLTRLPIAAARAEIGDLLAQGMTDDRLREIRARLMDDPRFALIAGSPSFYDLAGVHDLVAHRHEDPFDITRIQRAVEHLGLEFMGFALPTPAHRKRYRKEHPDDPWRRDFDAWRALERQNFLMFGGMYDFHCRKPD